MPKQKSGKPARKDKEAQGKAQKETDCGELVVPPKELSKPLRARIVAVANLRVISPSEFAREFHEKIDEVAYDFRVLRDKGWLELVTEAPGLRGSSRHMYRATKRALIRGAEWRLFSTAIKAGFRQVTLQDFAARAAQAIDAGTFDAQDDSNFAWKAIVLDDEGWRALAEAMKRTFDEVMQIEADSAERLGSGKAKHQAIPATFAIAGFESPEEEQPELPADEKPKVKGKKNGKGAGSAKRRKK